MRPCSECTCRQRANYRAWKCTKTDCEDEEQNSLDYLSKLYQKDESPLGLPKHADDDEDDDYYDDEKDKKTHHVEHTTKYIEGRSVTENEGTHHSSTISKYTRPHVEDVTTGKEEANSEETVTKNKEGYSEQNVTENKEIHNTQEEKEDKTTNPSTGKISTEPTIYNTNEQSHAATTEQESEDYFTVAE